MKLLLAHWSGADANSDFRGRGLETVVLFGTVPLGNPISSKIYGLATTCLKPAPHFLLSF